MFYFTVKYYDEDACKVREDSGIVGAATCGAAADKVAEYYGRDNICRLTMVELEDVLTEEDVLDTFESEEN